ncbi:MAG: pseudaminic acid cytidylyltransferase [Bacteroidales bacterium]|nr:pseudaminic acid cytidylyltransferase [Bacteroidales bacterium]MCF8405475.1 pseudaminic acid cytidylyltransferase [Bacteroidales bacterium]
MENLVIIPARGGSQRIPGKNIAPFHGKPIISYSIDIAKISGLFQEIMVSTDDPKIAEVALEYGASIPFFRSEKNSDHFATISDVVSEVLSSYRDLGKTFKYVCCILPTSPLISLYNLRKGYELLLSEKYHSVRPVIRYSYPVQRAVFLKDGKVDFIHPENARVRSQDLEPAFHDAGQFYWMYFDKGMIATEKGGFEISELEAQDIDNEMDWKLAELKYSLLQKK